MKKIVFVLGLLLTILAAGAQLPGGVNIDQLTDAQIQQMIQTYGLSGLSEAELIAKAKEKGLSDAQFQQLKARMGNLPGANNTANTGDKKEGNEGKRKPVNYLLPKSAPDSINGLLIYGSEIFTKENLTFEPNLNMPTPRNYVLGAGDQIKVDVFGYSDKSQSLTISPDGTIRYPNIGPIRLAGLSVADAENKLVGQLSRIYPGLKAGNTSLQLSLNQIRTIQVNLIGEITRPGSYNLSSLSTIANALYAAGGPTKIGSYRNIELVRAGKTIARFDLYAYLMRGDLTQNKVLQDEDVIRVAPYTARVEWNGAVKRRAIYEVSATDKLADLLLYAGGLADTANKDFIRVSRFGRQDREVFVVPQNQLSQFGLQTGDKIYVDSLANVFKNRVRISGAVYYQGTYSVQQTPTLRDLLLLAKPKENAYKERAILRRLNSDFVPEMLGFDLEEVLNGKTSIALQREDSIHVYSLKEVKEPFTVEIRGEVNHPEVFAYSKGMQVQDVILMAGGYRDGATRNSVEVARRIRDTSATTAAARYATILNVDLNDNKDALATALEPFDIVSIRKSPGYKEQINVSIEGEVVYPGQYAIASNKEKLSDLLKRAGGIKEGGYPEGAFLLRKTFEGLTPNDSVILNNKIGTLKASFSDTVKAKAADSTLRDDMKMVGIKLDQVINDPSSIYDVLLQDGDIIKVPKKIETVQTFSGVYFPKKIVYQEGLNVKQVIRQSGGLIPGGQRKKAYVVYPNGEVKTTKRFLFFRNYPAIKPGSEIYVPVKASGRSLSTAEILGITTGLATLATMVITITNLTK